MKEKPRIQFLWLLLVISISFFVFVISVSASTVTNNQFVIYSVHSANNDYTVEATNDNYIVFRQASQKLWSQKIDRQIGSIAISSDGDNVAVGCDGGVIYFYGTSWSVQLLWTRTFGDATISSISFQKNGNFIEVTNTLNQAFLVTRTGNLVPSSITQSVTSVPSSTLSSIPKTAAPIDYFPANLDTNSIFGNIYFVWIVLALLILFVFWVIFSSYRKKGTVRNYQPPPPQNGMIYVESIPYGAAIYFDGIYYGISPLTIYNAIPATHTIKATLNGYNSDTQRITIKAGQTINYSPTLRKSSPPPPKSQPQTQPQPKPQPKLSFQDLITQLGAKIPKDREEAQKQLINQVKTDTKTTIQKIIKELEKQPSTNKREIVNLLYYLSKESHEGQKVTEELINALTYSPPEVKWLIIQTLGRLKDKRALHALEAAVSDQDFLVKYWAIISLKSIQES
jgi:hypothetical protein